MNDLLKLLLQLEHLYLSYGPILEELLRAEVERSGKTREQIRADSKAAIAETDAITDADAGERS